MSAITRRQALALTPFALPSQAAPPAEDWREDVRFLSQELHRLHPGLKDKGRQEAFSGAIGKLDAVLTEQSDLGIRSGLLRVFHALGDSHTGIPLNALFGSRILPVGMYWYADGIYIAAAGDAAMPALGKRVAGIGGTKIDAVCSAAAELIPHENEWLLKHRLPQQLSFAGFLQAAGVAKPGQPVQLGYEGPKGERGTVELAPADMRTWAGFARVYDDRKKTPPLYRRNPLLAYWTERIEPTGTLYFHYGRCEDEPSRPFAAFLEGLRKEILSGSVERLIIDLRLNSGGDSSLLHSWIEFLRGSPLNRKGRLYGIIGRATYSSALMNAVHLTQKTQIVLAGEPSGGKPNHCGEVRQIVLPRSKLPVFCSTRYFRMVDGDTDSLTPALRATMSFADYSAGRDPFLEAILKSL